VSLDNDARLFAGKLKKVFLHLSILSIPESMAPRSGPNIRYTCTDPSDSRSGFSYRSPAPSSSSPTLRGAIGSAGTTFFPLLLVVGGKSPRFSWICRNHGLKSHRVVRRSRRDAGCVNTKVEGDAGVRLEINRSRRRRLSRSKFAISIPRAPSRFRCVFLNS